jgi:LuxR family maltose regulon positive regulatory protein
LDGAESQLLAGDLQHLEGEAAAVRAYVASAKGDVPLTIKFAHQALELLPEEKWFARGSVSLSLGIAYQSTGELAAANRALSEAIKFSRATERTHLRMVATAILGHVQEMQGLLRQAVETHREVLRLASDQGGRPVPFAGIAYVGLAEVLYAWNDLDGAMRSAMEGIDLSGQGGFFTNAYALAGHAILARVQQAWGNVDGALDEIQKAQRLAQSYDYAYVVALVAEQRVRLWVARGNMGAASQWAREHRLSPVDELNSGREVEQMAVARVLTAEGRPGEALRLLALLLEAAEATGRMGSVIKILVLQALALQAQGEMDQALSALERVLSLAEPQGFVRTFVDEGEPMARLLRRALTLGMAPNYVSRLLAAFGETAEPPPAIAQPLIEPLSERELEVLRLIVAGLSNREIAQELVIAVSTVKSHVNHIYGKLGVKNRIQAVARAQDLGLL